MRENEQGVYCGLGMGKRARVLGCKYIQYILENVSMTARMEDIMGALKGDIKNVGQGD